MASHYLNIEKVNGFGKPIGEDLKFRTGKFVWTIRFNNPLDSSTINNMNLNVTTLNQIPLRTVIRYDTTNNVIEIEPLESYSQDETYVLNISDKVKSVGGQNLKRPVHIQFKFNEQ